MSTMSGYTKLFNSILASTVWSEPMETRIVWITLLAMADKHGIVEGSTPGLAVFARLPVEATRIALERLSSPDADSRSKECEGRRIEAVEGGWRLINHAKYRSKMGADERREYLKVKQREYRRKAAGVSVASTNVNNVSDTDTLSTHAEAEAEANTKEETVRTATPPIRSTPIIARRRKDAAWEGARVYVPQRVHTDFLAIRGEDSEPSLLEFYAVVDYAWSQGRHAKDEPGADMIRFWKARYDEKWPATVTPKQPANVPQWARDIKAKQAQP